MLRCSKIQDMKLFTSLCVILENLGPDVAKVYRLITNSLLDSD